ncbi:MAG: glycosyltransferase family 4 protein [Pyrinomonadaceae bacterium]
MKKKVLQFIGSFHQGGSERQAIALASMLMKEGSFNVSIATLNRDGVLLKEAEAIVGGDIAEFSLTSFYDTNFVKQVRSCAKYLRNNKIDIVHTHDFYTNVFGMAAGALARVPVRIASKRETGGMRSRAQELVERMAMKFSHAIVANSISTRDYLAASIRDKARVIYNGVDLARFNGNGHSANGCRSVAMVANLRHDVKNVPMFLRAAKRVVAAYPDATFVIAGEGELDQQLRRVANELGVTGNVQFIGRCTDVPALLATSKACVLTSRAEGFSNSILEYMAAGKPVVATNVGGAGEAIVDGTTGYLVASDDDEAMAKRLLEILGDEKRAEEMGDAGQRRIRENFSSDVQLEMTLRLYNELLSK